MHLGIRKRNCKCYTVVDEVYKYSDSNNLESFKQDQQLTNCTLTFKARIYMDCYMREKKYKSWDGLFYHKRKVHKTAQMFAHVDTCLNLS